MKSGNIHIFTKPKKNYTKKLRQARKKRGAPGHTSKNDIFISEKTNRRSLQTLPRR